MGSKAAKEKIVSDNTGLVWSIARRFVNRGYDLEELQSWEAEHLKMLLEIAPEEFDIKHYAALAELEVRK